MCRLASFPPGFSRKEAISVLWNFRKGNTDGVGSVHVKNGKFHQHKWPKSLDWALRNTNFLDFMPHDGWTLVHLRAASHGGNFRRNTHPFIIKDRAVIHNGVWLEYDMAKLLLAAQGIRPRGETDTEVGAHVIDVVGVRKFGESVTGGGVFMSLSRDGSLEIAKTSGDLMVNKDASGKVLIASELEFAKYTEGCETVDGYMKFGADGKYIKHVEKDSSWASTMAAADDTDDDEDEDAEDIGEVGKTVRNFSKLLLQYVPQPTASGAHEAAIISTNCGIHAQRPPMMAGMGRCGGISSQYFSDQGYWE